MSKVYFNSEGGLEDLDIALRKKAILRQKKANREKARENETRLHKPKTKTKRKPVRRNKHVDR